MKNEDRPQWRRRPLPTHYRTIPESPPPTGRPIPLGVWILIAFFFVAALVNFVSYAFRPDGIP